MLADMLAAVEPNRRFVTHTCCKHHAQHSTAGQKNVDSRECLVWNTTGVLWGVLLLCGPSDMSCIEIASVVPAFKSF